MVLKRTHNLIFWRRNKKNNSYVNPSYTVWGLKGGRGGYITHSCLHDVLECFFCIFSPELLELLDHCTTSRAYFFCIKKCGEADCRICRKPRLPFDIFKQLHRFPDPVPGLYLSWSST